MVPIVLVQMVTTYVFFDRHWSRVITRLSSAVAGEVALIADQVERIAVPEDVAVMLAKANDALDLWISYEPGEVLEAAGVVEADSGWEIVVADVFVEELKRRVERDFALYMRFEDKRVLLRVALADGVLDVRFPERRLFSSSGYIYLLWVFASALILALVAMAFMRNQVRPIRKLAAAAERFGRGRDVQFFKPQGAREVRQAGDAFLNMHKRIRRQIEQRTFMLAGVSHDLRTPLTRMKLQLAMLGDGQDVQDMRKDIEDMERMITGYLDFVRGDGDEQARKVKVSEVLKEAAQQADEPAGGVQFNIIDDVEIEVRSVAMSRCLRNVISNAARYAQAVHCSAYEDDDGLSVHIVIEDDGPGLSPEQYEDVFRPFYRADEARSNGDGSVGLGLPIAMDIVLSHGGRIWLDRSQALGGLAVHVVLPI
jgi:two-component system osmolarity sensor histidine kinase EnvZ